MVIFLFLRNVSATIIPSLAVPFSIVGTFAVMYLLGYTIDIISLMALTLCVGFVVDDAVVMLENIVRHMEAGESRMEAALKGARRDRVHDPVDDGVAGRGVHPRAVHGRRGRAAAPRVRRHHRRRRPRLRPRVADAHAHAVQPLPAAARTGAGNRLYRASERVFDGDACTPTTVRCSGCYGTGGRRWPCSPSPSCSPRICSSSSPRASSPTRTPGSIFAFTEAAQDISFESMVEHQRAVADVVRQSPHVEQFMSFIGASGSNVVPNTGRIFIRLKPRSQRPPAEAVIAGAAAQARGGAGHARLPAGAAHDPHRRPARRRRSTSTRCRTPTSRSCTTGRPSCTTGSAQLPEPAGRQHRSADHEPPGRRRHRPRQGGRARRDRGPDRERPRQRLRLQAGLDHLHAVQPVLGHPRGGSAVPAGRDGPGRACTCARAPAAWCRSARWPRSPLGWDPSR